MPPNVNQINDYIMEWLNIKSLLLSVKWTLKPGNVDFRWSFNNSENENLEIITFTSEGRRSVATYTPRNHRDYGMLFCLAQNNIGLQSIPCTFFVIPVTSPEPPENCTINNITIHSLTIECLPGFSGGLEQLSI